MRVCQPGGLVIMANRTPEGFVGQLLKTIGKHLPPPALMPSPLMWGAEAPVRARLEGGSSSLKVTLWQYPFHYPFPPAEVVEVYRID